MSEANIFVALVDDHPAVSLGVQAVLNRNPAIVIVGHAQDSTGLVELLNETRCDLLISDFSMPGGKYGDGLALVSYLTRNYPNLRTIIHTMSDNPMLIWALVRQEIMGVVSKCDSPSHLLSAVNSASAGRRYYSPVIQELFMHNMRMGDVERLTPRETEIVRLFCAGGTITDIAQLVHRSVQTVSTQKRSAMRKLGVTTDAALVRHVLSNGIKTSLDMAGATDAEPAA